VFLQDFFSLDIKKVLGKPSVIAVFLLIIPLPFLFLFFSFYTEMEKLNEFDANIERLHKKSEEISILKVKESSFLGRLKNANHHFIDENLESLVLLQSEIKKLEEKNIENSETLKQRLKFLTDGSNHLKFIEESLKNHENLHEAEERLQHPVEMNVEDLKKLLCLVEGIHLSSYTPLEDSPQLVIKNFELSKKITSSEEEVYSLDMRLIKREIKGE
jgi:hypothetical protein